MKTEDPPLTSFIYGHSKAGKTTLTASVVDVPEMMPAVMVDFGTSSASVQGEPKYRDLDVFRVLEFDGVSEVHTMLSSGPKGGNLLAEKGYRTIILDEGDKLHRQAITKVMRRNVRDGDRYGKSRVNMSDVQLQDFGEARDMVLAVYEAFLKFNVNLLVTSLVRIKEDELQNNREYRMPSLAGQLRDDIPSMMALYTYLDVNRDGERVAYFTPTYQFKAGVWGLARADRFGAEMKNPTMRKIYDAFVGKDE